MPIQCRSSMKAIGASAIILPRVSETEGRPSLAIKYAKRRFCIKRRGGQPRQLRANVAQAFRAECASQNERLIHERPLMRMLRILPPERGKKLAALHLKISRKRSRLKVCFFQLDLSFII